MVLAASLAGCLTLSMLVCLQGNENVKPKGSGAPLRPM